MRELESLVQELQAPDSPAILDFVRPTLIFGPGAFGRAVAEALLAREVPLVGFVATRPSSPTCMGLPIYAPRDAAAVQSTTGAQVVVGVFNRDLPYTEIAATCTSAGLESLCWPFEFYPQIADGLGWRYWLGRPTELGKHVDEMVRAFGLLSDMRSRDLLLRVVRFRGGRDFGYSGYRDPEPQYFSPLSLSVFGDSDICYVDCGAFDGDSYAELKDVRHVREAFLFEPDPTNFSKLVGNVGQTAGVVCLPLGAYDHYEVLSFGGSGELAGIAVGGTSRVVVASLDDVLGSRPVDFLKLDIEGSEAAALNGARRVIERHRPVIAASLYHRQNDLWQLPLLLATLTEGYDFHIRQHLFNSLELVLYAIPRTR